MALEMKVGDLLLLGATLTFIIGSLIGIFGAFDNDVQSQLVSTELNSLDSNVSSKTKATEAELQTLITTDTGFKVKENIYIDERGDAEASLSSENTKTTLKTFISNIKNSNKTNFVDGTIWIYIISTIVFIGSILGLRMVIGNGRI